MNWTFDQLEANGEVIPRFFPTKAKAARARAKNVLELMTGSISLAEMYQDSLPRIYREEWEKLARQIGLKKPQPRYWPPAARRAAAVRLSRRHAAKRAAKLEKEAENLPPVSALTERATVKLLVRLRLRFPHAAEETLCKLARMDAGAF
jgi:hypothetical protein